MSLPSPPSAGAGAESKTSDPVTESNGSTLAAPTPQLPLRSWRKKYRKLRMRFATVMDDSNAFFKEQKRVLALARRLQEENDQLKELLLELQESSCLQPSVADVLAELGPKNAALPEPLGITEDDAHLRAVLTIPNLSYDIKQDPEKIASVVKEDMEASYFDPVYEEEYLTTLDADLLDPILFHDTSKPLQVAASRKLPSDKDLANQNQDSVVSWLRRNHPESFIQDIEKPAPKHRGKRISLAAKEQPDAAAVDEDVSTPVEKPVRGKKHKDDDAYRPKGGSSRATKRKREDGDKAPGRGKRSKVQASP